MEIIAHARSCNDKSEFDMEVSVVEDSGSVVVYVGNESEACVEIGMSVDGVPYVNVHTNVADDPVGIFNMPEVTREEIKE